MKRILIAAVPTLAPAPIVVAPALAAEVSRDPRGKIEDRGCEVHESLDGLLFLTGKDPFVGLRVAHADRFDGCLVSVELTKTVGELRKVRQTRGRRSPLVQVVRAPGCRGGTVLDGRQNLNLSDKAGAEHIVTVLSRNRNKPNPEVLPFDFGYCRLEPSKFS